MASGGGGLIGATGDGDLGAAQPARVGAVGVAVGCSGTLHGSGTPGESSDLGSGSRAMPHLELRGQRLDDAYSPLTVPQDEILQDAARDEDDALLQTGLREAARIAREAKEHGRKRKMSPKEEPQGSERAKETAEEVVLVEDKTETTGRWALGRRRSKKESLDFHSFLDPRDLDSGNVRRPLEDESELPSYLSYRVDAYVQSCISVSDLCSRVLRRVARASHAQLDHLG